MPDRAGNPCGTASFSINLPPLEGESQKPSREAKADVVGGLITPHTPLTFSRPFRPGIPRIFHLSFPWKPGPPVRHSIHHSPLEGESANQGRSPRIFRWGERSFRFTRRREGPCCRTGPGTHATQPPAPSIFPPLRGSRRSRAPRRRLCGGGSYNASYTLDVSSAVSPRNSPDFPLVIPVEARPRFLESLPP